MNQSHAAQSISLCAVMMFGNLGSMEQLVLCVCVFCFFLCMKLASPIEIHQQLLEVIGDDTVRVQHVRICCRELKYGQSNIHNDEAIALLGLGCCMHNPSQIAAFTFS